MGRTRPFRRRNTKLAVIQSDSDSSSDVVIVEEINVPQPIHCRNILLSVINNRNSLSDSCTIRPKVKTRLSLRSQREIQLDKEQPSVSNISESSHLSHNFNENENVPPPSIDTPVTITISTTSSIVEDSQSTSLAPKFQERSPSLRLPSVHELIDSAAAIGAALSISGRPPHHSAQTRREHKYQVSASGKKRDVLHGSFTKEMHSRLKNSSSMRSPASKVDSKNMLSFIASQYTIRHPFLYPWERDEARSRGGEWRCRRDCYLALRVMLDVMADTDLHGSPLGKSGTKDDSMCLHSRRALGKRQPAARRDYSPPVENGLLKHLPTLEPFLLGYRWLDADISQLDSNIKSPQKMLFWR